MYNWYVLWFSVECLLAGLKWNSTWSKDIQLKSSMPPDDGLQICPKHVEVD
jgi:hypothetical protein